MPEPRKPAAKPPSNPGRLNRPPSEPPGYDDDPAVTRSFAAITASAGAPTGGDSKIPSVLLARLGPPSRRASASSAHNSRATAIAANAASDRNHCMGTLVLPIDVQLVREGETFRPVAKRRTRTCRTAMHRGTWFSHHACRTEQARN